MNPRECSVLAITYCGARARSTVAIARRIQPAWDKAESLEGARMGVIQQEVKVTEISPLDNNVPIQVKRMSKDGEDHLPSSTLFAS